MGGFQMRAATWCSHCGGPSPPFSHLPEMKCDRCWLSGSRRQKYFDAAHQEVKELKKTFQTKTMTKP